MRRWILPLVLCAAAAGCATAPPPPPQSLFDGLFDDAQFAPPSEPIGADTLFTPSDAMKRYVRDELAAPARRDGRQWGLVNTLNRTSGLKLDYDSAVTRTASQAFEARSGNCLSLLVMTAALAKELGLQVTYQSAVSGEIWSRAGGLYLASGHVNIVIGPHLLDKDPRDVGGGLVVDFIPPEQARMLRMQPISEATVAALFLNNRAAEAMVQGREDDAYWWARAAIVRQPMHRNAYNTLGIVYLHRGDLARAERAFAAVLGSEPDNYPAMANLVQTLDRAGKPAEAAQWQHALERIAPRPPFYFFEQGRAAMARGDFAQARDLFTRELQRDGVYHEFHFWLALANARLGNEAEARKHLALAERYSPSGGDRALYAAKLASLQASVH